MTRQAGFTLAEVLVALLVFSMIAAASVYALRLGIDAKEQFAASETRLARLEAARLILKEDLAQATDRRVRDEFGQIAGPAFRGGLAAQPRSAPAGERRLFVLVRGGWTNPESAAPRSDLQYVEYLEKDGALVRRIRPFLDDARGQPRHDRVLIEDARDLRVQFLAGETRGRLDWGDEWPLPGSAVFPKAVALEHLSSRWGALRHLFWIGDPGSPARRPS